ncbi:hypothetical protein OC846_004500 [Tilletia horrida]|uniref:Homeobox domain-containing protein n=1 Tax=Tilletia horrida TaxID=155126 RepID=A0AAN6GN27_9BASI|nr:hypothetical protein OC845_006162 [Tilletia horrida]KAK0548370.1 hypothetical protein OC846_004500 [Tilletia horrida]KAK0563508.1 hypothetical protein OC861_004761 [Tilletia horrida]
MFATPNRAPKSDLFSFTAPSGSGTASGANSSYTTSLHLSEPATWLQSASYDQKNRAAASVRNSPPNSASSSTPVPRTVSTFTSGLDSLSTPPSTASSSNRLFPSLLSAPGLSQVNSTMSSFYPADFSHSAPGSASGSASSNHPGPARAGVDGSRPYTMAGYLGGTGPNGASGTSAPYYTGAEHGQQPGGMAPGGPSYQNPAGASANNGSGAAVLTGYRPASSHDNFSNAAYNHPSSRSSFSAYNSTGASGGYGSPAVASSSSTATPYHHGGYAHPGYGPGSSAPGGASGMQTEYSAYPPQAAGSGSDPAMGSYASGVPGYANAAGQYSYGGAQPGVYPGAHLGANPAGGAAAAAPGTYGFNHPPNQPVHYLNPFEVKHRRRTTKGQFRVLEGTFKENPKPNANVRKALAAQLDMPGRAVQIWFQNRRAKAKAQAKKEEQASRERAATAEGSTGSSKTSQQAGAGQAHARSVTAPQPQTNAANGGAGGSSGAPGAAADSYQKQQGDYRHPQQLPQQGGAYGQAAQLHSHHAMPPHHSMGGPGNWHQGHNTSSRG